MKRVVKASASTDQTVAINKAKAINAQARKLLDLLEDTPSGFIDANDLEDVYTALLDAIPALDFAINTKTVAYEKDEYGIISNKF